MKSYVDELRRDLDQSGSGERDAIRSELHALQSQIASLEQSPRPVEAPVPSASSLHAELQGMLSAQLAPILDELRRPSPRVDVQVQLPPEAAAFKPGRRSSLASVKADLAALKHSQEDRPGKESILRSVKGGIDTYVRDLRRDVAEATAADKNAMREELSALQRALNSARSDQAHDHDVDHELLAEDHSALLAIQAKLDALTTEFRAPPAEARENRRTSFLNMKRDLEDLKRRDHDDHSRRRHDHSESQSSFRSESESSLDESHHRRHHREARRIELMKDQFQKCVLHLVLFLSFSFSVSFSFFLPIPNQSFSLCFLFLFFFPSLYLLLCSPSSPPLPLPPNPESILLPYASSSTSSSSPSLYLLPPLLSL